MSVWDDIDLVEGVELPTPSPALPLCEHRFGVRVETGGYSRETDPDSPYFGLWVHGNPDCRRPSYLKEQQ